MTKGKSKKGFFIYLSFVLALSGFALYQYKADQKEQKQKAEKEKVFPSLQSYQVQKIQIIKKKETIELQSTKGSWRLIKPIEDLADEDNINNWLDGLLQQKAQIKKENDIQWEEYDLDKNTDSIKLVNSDNKTFQIHISRYSGFDGSFFIKKAEKLLLGGIEWAQVMNKSRSYFRSFKVINTKQHPVFLSYQSGGKKYSLKWKHYQWHWEENKKTYPLKSSAVESYWTALANMQFDKEPDAYTKKLRNKYKLHKPYIRLKLNFDKDKKWELKISPKVKNKYYAKVLGRNYVFSLPESRVQQILHKDMMFRDHNKPFKFDKSKVQTVIIKNQHIKLTLKKDEKDKWTVVEKLKHSKSTTAESSKLDTKEIADVLSLVSILSAKKYFSKKKSFAAAAEIILKDKTGALVLHLKFSKPFTSKKHIKSVYVSSSQGREIMTLSIQDFESIFSKKFLKESKNENSTNQKPSKD